METNERWIDRLACVEAVAIACADNGFKFDPAFRTILISDYFYGSKLTTKQRATLKRDALVRSKEIIAERRIADLGDIVKISKLVPTGTLLGGHKRQGSAFVEAEVIGIQRTSSWVKYRFRRLSDGEIQEGNGHSIKSVVRRAADPQGVTS